MAETHRRLGRRRPGQSRSTLAFHRLAGTTIQLFSSSLATPRAVRLAGPSAANGGRAVTDEYPDT